MNDVIVVGLPGGREHALAAAMRQSPEVNGIFLTGTNVGAQDLDRTYDLGISPDNKEAIADAAVELDALVVFGPEKQAIDGLGNYLRSQGVLVFGPDEDGAQLEGSKARTREFANRHGILHPISVVVDDIRAGMAVMGERGGVKNWVIKADGSAGGKGVYLPETTAGAREILSGMMSGDLFGEAGKRVVIQEKWTGPEVSVFIITDGNRYTVVPFFVQDHKRLLEGDKGPNTGGMGAYAPVPESIILPQQEQQIYDMADKIVAGLHEEQIDYKGIIFAGVMLPEQHHGEPGLLEINVRFGDPEAQVLLPLMQAAGVDTYDLFRQTAEGKLPKDIRWQSAGRAALTVCMAAQGYPGIPYKGDEIFGLSRNYDGVTVYHGSTREVQGKRVLTDGGRVLYVTGHGQTIDEAAEAAFGAIGPDGIWFRGEQHRPDIGHQALSAA